MGFIDNRLQIVLDEKNTLIDILYDGQSFKEILPCVFKITTEYDCEYNGLTLVNFSCYVNDIEYIKQIEE